MKDQLPVPETKSFHFSSRQSVALVFLCTLFGAAAQMLIKSGANALASGSPLAMLTNLPLVAGYSLYGISTVLLVLALSANTAQSGFSARTAEAAAWALDLPSSAGL